MALAAEVTARNAAILAANPTGVSTYTPTVTANGSMTINTVVVDEASYSTGNSPFVDLTVGLTFTTAGTASNVVYISTPTNAIAQGAAFAMDASLDPITAISKCQVTSGNRIAVFYADLSNLTLAAGHRISLSLRYRKI